MASPSGGLIPWTTIALESGGRSFVLGRLRFCTARRIGATLRRRAVLFAKDHDGSLLDNLGGFLGNPKPVVLGPLGKLLGGR